MSISEEQWERCITLCHVIEMRLGGLEARIGSFETREKTLEINILLSLQPIISLRTCLKGAKFRYLLQ
jgi:hypothetical protein